MFDGIKKLFKNLNRADSDNVGFDPDGEMVSRQDVIALIKQEYDRRKSERQALELQWQLNLNFICGNQYSEIDTASSVVKPLPKTVEWQSREVFNRVGTIYDVRQAKLSQVRPSMTVRPYGNEPDDVLKAETATGILKGVQSLTHFNQYVQSAFAWGDIAGTCFFYSWWDKDKGSEIEPGVCEGDIGYGILTPYEVFPDSLYNQDISDCQSILIHQVKDVNEIYNLYGIKAEPQQLETFTVAAVPSAGGYGYESAVLSNLTGMRDNCNTVDTYFIKPCRDYPNGIMAIVIGGTELYYYGEIPFKIGEDGERGIPLVKFCSGKRTGQFFGYSYVERLIPVQRAYNALKNRKLDYLSRCALGSYEYTDGMIDEETADLLESEGLGPGTLIRVSEGGKGLRLIDIPTLPGTFENEESRLQSEFEYLSGISEMSVISSAPGSNMSGTALNSIKDADTTRLAIVSENMRLAVAEVSKMWLRMFKQFCYTPRIFKYTGSNSIAQVLVWSKDDITSFDIVPTTENEMNDTLEARREFIMQLLNNGLLQNEQGIITDDVRENVLEALKLGNFTDIDENKSLQKARAVRENTELDMGIAPVIQDFDDHEIHIKEHNKFRLQSRFELFASKNNTMAQMFDEHIKQHQAILQQKTAEAAAMMGGGGQ